MQKSITKSLVSGTVAAVAANILYGNSDITVMGINTSAVTVVGGSVAVGSLASDYISESIIEKMDVPQNVKSIEETLVRGGVCGAASAGVMLGLTDMGMAGAPQAFVLGAGSKIGGDMLEEQLFGARGWIGPIF
jgi:hypothetical protein